jgi:hypothetical protein
MQDPNADTEWNDVLRAKGILPAKQETEITEDDILSMVDQTIQQKTNGPDLSEMSLAELDDKEDDVDEEEERIFEAYRRQRLDEMKAAQAKARYGEVREISKDEYVREVNKAGDGVWVVLHIYKQGVPLCSLINQHLSLLARKFPDTKFLRSVSSVCIPNYPDKNLPTIFIYCEGEMKKQWVGPLEFGGMNLTINELEWRLSQTGAVKTTLEENPRKEVKDVLTSSIRGTNQYDDSDSD